MHISPCVSCYWFISATRLFADYKFCETLKRQNDLSSFVRRQTTKRVKKEAKKLQEISVVIVLGFYFAHFPSFIGIQLLVIFSNLYSTIT